MRGFVLSVRRGMSPSLACRGAGSRFERASGLGGHASRLRVIPGLRPALANEEMSLPARSPSLFYLFYLFSSCTTSETRRPQAGQTECQQRISRPQGSPTESKQECCMNRASFCGGVAKPREQQRPGFPPRRLGYHHHPRFSSQNATGRKLLKFLPRCVLVRSVYLPRVVASGSGLRRGKAKQGMEQASDALHGTWIHNLQRWA